MKAIVSILFFSGSLYFVSCSSDEQKNGTDQNAPNTLESLINPNANTSNPSATISSVSQGSTSVQDIWVLAGINSKEKYDVNLVNNTPMLDLDSAKSSLSGHTGCNSLSGKVKIKGNTLLFDSVHLTSNQPCKDNRFEKKLLSSLKSGSTSYKIVNDTLSMNVGGGTNFYFRRIRRN